MLLQKRWVCCPTNVEIEPDLAHHEPTGTVRGNLGEIVNEVSMHNGDIFLNLM